MRLSLKYIAQAIKTARQQKGLSQRALSAKVGVPQSHLSKIENAAVDLQTSSLIEIARALDLELVLAPRQLLPAIEGLQRSATTAAAPPAYRLDEGLSDG
ncbi:MAG: XRE family transcriptional regulator [Proteobacteria bacterium]|nr:MAG: XRE family transcriptional regulator [Pseudomonadota bacterium]